MMLRQRTFEPQYTQLHCSRDISADGNEVSLPHTLQRNLDHAVFDTRKCFASHIRRLLQKPSLRRTERRNCRIALVKFIMVKLLPVIVYAESTFDLCVVSILGFHPSVSCLIVSFE